MGRLDVAEAVDRLLAEGKAANKARQKLTEELAGYHAASLLLQHPLQGDRRVVRVTFTDQDAAYLKLLASRLIASAPQTVRAAGHHPGGTGPGGRGGKR